MIFAIPDAGLAFMRTVTITVVVLAYAFAPLLPLLDPEYWVVGGSLLALGIFTGGMQLARSGENYAGTFFIIAFALGGAGAGFMAVGVRDANQTHQANKNRCLAIQRDMLSARPLRDDGPDLFQALGCKPQGEGSVHTLLARKRNAPVIE